MERVELRLNHRVIGGRHVFTSEDMPELWVSHERREAALAEIEPVVNMIRRQQGLSPAVVTPNSVLVEAA